MENLGKRTRKDPRGSTVMEVHLVAEPAFEGGSLKWLDGLVGETDREKFMLTLVQWESDDGRILSPAEILIILAAKRCYKSFVPGLNPNVTTVRDDPKEFLLNILKSGHGSVLEHAQVTFAIEGVSRVLTHELVRHRIGAFSQESMRYVSLEEGANLVFAPELPEGEEEKNLVQKINAGLREMCSAIPDDASFAVKKRLTSAIRRLVPMGVETGIVWSTNLRNLRHVLATRTARASEWEIRRLFNTIGDICLKEWPLVFQDFTKVGAETDVYGLAEFVPMYPKV
jgi:thymidylate synthase (FAD)